VGTSSVPGKIHVGWRLGETQRARVIGALEYCLTNLGNNKDTLQGWRLHFVPAFQWADPEPKIPASRSLEAGCEVAPHRHSISGFAHPNSFPTRAED
jgi:hypothetical protein